MGTIDPGAVNALLDQLFKGCGTAPTGITAGQLFDFPPALDPNDFTESDTDPGFGQLFADGIGDTGAETDGFDLTLLDTLAIIDALDSTLGEALGFAEDAFSFTDGIDPASIAGDVQAFADS